MQSLIFDLDGVLVDSDQHHKRTLREAAARFGYSVQDNGTITTLEKLRAAGVPEEQIPEIYALKRSLYDEYVSDVLAPNPELSILLLRLDKVGYNLAVCSNSNLTSVRLVLDKIGVAPYIRVVTSASEVKQGKPDPEVYNLTIARLKTIPANVVVFEDSDEGALAAKRAGVCKIIRCTTETIVSEATKWL